MKSAPQHDRCIRVLLVVGMLALGAGSFVAVFHYSLKGVPPAQYEVRDDAVVTLSHARNLIEYGFVGVSPSGERIEGFSAPLQFWVAALVYAFVRFDYATFLRWQVQIGTILLGAAFAGLLLFPTPPEGRRAWRYVFVGFAVIAAAQILATSRAFLLWHASGMENVYKEVTLLALLWALDAMLRSGRIKTLAVVLVFVAAVSRVDAILPVSILLSAFAGLWWLRHRDGRALLFVGLSVVPWMLYMVWRRWYFSQWEPNTAVAQAISVVNRLGVWVNSPSATLADHSQWLLRVGRSLHALQFAWLPVLLLLTRRDRDARDRCVMVFAAGFACLMQYAFFGPARMDEARTVTELALFATALVPFVLLAPRDFRPRDLIAGVFMVGTSLAYAQSMPPDRHEIGWGTTWFESNANEVDAAAREYDIPRPLLANPDLGAVSWRKHFNVIDLGRLGSAVIPRTDHPERYLIELAKPDLIELHDIWSCAYRDLFSNRQFLDEYTAVRSARTPWLASNCPAPQAMSGLWVRRAVLKGSGTPERAFIDRFRSTLDLTAIREELSRCTVSSEPHPCSYVGRTLFRFVPELKRAGRYERVSALLAQDHRLTIERAYFTSSDDANWWRDVLGAFH